MTAGAAGPGCAPHKSLPWTQGTLARKNLPPTRKEYSLDRDAWVRARETNRPSWLQLKATVPRAPFRPLRDVHSRAHLLNGLLVGRAELEALLDEQVEIALADHSGDLAAKFFWDNGLF